MIITDELDRLLQTGIKGMKWGVRRKGSSGNIVVNAIKARNKKYDDRARKIADEYHSKNQNKSVYKRQYERNLKKANGNHHKAVLRTRKEVREAKMAIAYSLTPIVAPVIAKSAVKGMNYAGAAYRQTATPSNIIKGKNLIMAMKNSPVRYADVSKYADIIDM